MIKAENKKLPNVKDPFKLVEGIFSHLKGKYTSVELQHEALRLWIKKLNNKKGIQTALLSEKSLTKEWLTKEKDEAWKNL